MRRAYQSSRGALQSEVCLSEIEEPHRGVLSPQGLSGHEIYIYIFVGRVSLVSQVCECECECACFLWKPLSWRCVSSASLFTIRADNVLYKS